VFDDDRSGAEVQLGHDRPEGRVTP
jgi:hypothetical protein